MASTADSGEPLVSCLLVTQPDRFPLVTRSIADYCRQSYAARELVILCSSHERDDRRRLEDHVAALARPDIRLVFISAHLPLGAARNRSLEAARGQYICQWDDDDLHHPTRIEAQVGALRRSGKQACLLRDVYHFLARDGVISWGDWGATEGGVHPGTLLAEAACGIRYPEAGPTSVVGEDTVVLRALWDRGGFHALGEHPHLFVYVAHGGNSWSQDHHRTLARGLAVPRAALLAREDEVRRGLSDLDLPETTMVCGSDGPAFRLGASSPPSPHGTPAAGAPTRTTVFGARGAVGPTILLAQEFGSNLGHVRRLIAVARALGPARYVLAVPHAEVVRPLVAQALGPEVEVVGGMDFRAAGLARSASTGDSTLADVFHHVGYGHEASLVRAAGRWRALVDRVAPDLVLCEFAPTLRLAVWDRVPTVVMGGAYETPPPGRHLPTVVPFGQLPGAGSLARERHLLAVAQAVRQQIGGPPLQVFSDLFQGERVFCIVPPGCDPYGHLREEPTYLPFPAPEISRPLPPFAARTGPDVFCFLWSDHPWLDLILTALNGLSRPSEVHIRGVDPQRLVSQCAPQVGIRPASADFAMLLPQTKVFLHYGGAAASYAALLAGVVQVVIPIHLEQEMTARGMVANGAAMGLVLNKSATAEQLRNLIAGALDDPARQASALDAAERAWRGRTADAVPAIVAACRDLLGTAA